MRTTPDSVLILHHAVPVPGSAHNAESDAGVMDEVKVVATALQAAGMVHRTASIRTLEDLPDLLRASPETTVFNLVESLPLHPSDAALVPSICDAFGKACTGNDAVCQSLCTDKWRTKAVLQAAGLPVPAGILVPPGGRVSAADLPKGALIVKPLFADASEGIHTDSVVPGPGKALDRAIRRIHEHFRHTALVEQFFGTRELNISVLQRGGPPEVLPLAEIEFRGYGRRRPRIVNYAAKWRPDSFEYRNTVRVIPTRLERGLAARIRQCARSAWKAVGCADYARVDVRLDDEGQFVILEVNPNPDISLEGGFAAALKAARIPIDDFVLAMVRNARQRRRQPAIPERRQVLPKPLIRYSIPSDRDIILRFLENTNFFRDGELEIAREVLDEALKEGPKGHYQSYTLTCGGEPAGWVCHGATPCTLGTFDIYWLGVSPAYQGRGYGRALLEHAERDIRQRKGRLIVIETSGHALYDSTRGFYLALGYRDAARVPDFYAPDDERVIYTKPLL